MSDVSTVARRISGFLRGELGLKGPIALHEPSFEGREWEYVKDCLDTGWVSTAGAYVERIEEMTAAACGTRYATAVVNGTAGLHAVLSAVGVGSDDLVICPALTFIATANAISYCKASPLFADVTASNLGIDTEKVAAFLENDCDDSDNGPIHRATGKRIAAMVPVHIFGHPADMAELVCLADSYGITVVEDAAEALGSQYHGRACGGLARAGVISFNGNKTVTTGGGGVIVTDDEMLSQHLKHITTTARIKDRWWFDHDEIGFNYRMPNINAALGCAQLENLNTLIARKRRLAAIYGELLSDADTARVLGEPEDCESNFWLNAVLFGNSDDRDQFLTLTNDADIQTRPCWRLISETAAYRNTPCIDGLETARDIVARLVNIPSGPRLLAMAEH